MELAVDWDDPVVCQKLEIICRLVFSKATVEAGEKTIKSKALPGSARNKRFYCNTQAILKILRGCLISHRFSQALIVLENMSPRVSSRMHGIYAKNSLYTLENMQHETAKDATEFFVRHVGVLSELNKRELLLEYLIYRLRNRQFEYPEHVSHKMLFGGLCLRKNKTLDPILEAYMTFYDYIAWTKTVHLCSRTTSCVSQFQEEAQNTSEKIISKWRDVISKPGNWDIFLEKLIQVLLTRNYREQCDQILKSYADSHPNHLNAYVYLELYRQNVDSNERRQNLKKIADMSPSDELVLDYVDILIEEQETSTAVKQVLLFLDYSVNKESLRGWTTLVEVVYSILLNQENKSLIILKHLWKERYQCWIKYHFDTEDEDFQNKEKLKLCSQKCLFLYMVLKSHDHIYIQTTYQNMKNLYPRKFLKLKKKVEMVDRLNKL